MPRRPKKSSEEAAFQEEAEETPESLVDLETRIGRFAYWSVSAMGWFERKVWKFLGRKKNPWGFIPQWQIDNFVIDFYAPKYLLALEADGPDHLKRKKEDQERDRILLEKGIQTLRLRPIDFVTNNSQQLFALIEEIIHSRNTPGVENVP